MAMDAQSNVSNRPAGLVSIVMAINAVVFIASAPILLLAPGPMAQLLGLNGDDTQLRWAVQVIGGCLIALAGYLWMIRRSTVTIVMTAAKVALVAECVTTFVTVFTPGEWKPMLIFFAAQGGVSALFYAIALLWAQRGKAPSAD